MLSSFIILGGIFKCSERAFYVTMRLFFTSIRDIDIHRVSKDFDEYKQRSTRKKRSEKLGQVIPFKRDENG